MEAAKLFGNAELLKRLRQYSAASNIPHAIIIEGADGSGRKSIAEYIALLLNCNNAPEICSKCAPCKKVISKNHPDVICSGLSEGRSLIGIETVRFIRSDAYIMPNESEYKVYIIDNADKMTPEAQNAFLKVLEEPPAYAVFILVCNSADLLLTTVRSRATIFKTERFSADEVSQYLLANNAEARAMHDSQPDMFKLAVTLSYGSIGKAIENLAPEISESCFELYGKVIELIDMLRRRLPAFDIMSFLSNAGFDKQRIDRFLNMFEDALSEILRVKLAENADVEFFIDEDTVLSSASALTALFLLEAIGITEQTRSALSMNANLQTTITAYAWNLCSLRDKY